MVIGSEKVFLPSNKLNNAHRTLDKVHSSGPGYAGQTYLYIAHINQTDNSYNGVDFQWYYYHNYHIYSNLRDQNVRAHILWQFEENSKKILTLT